MRIIDLLNKIANKEEVPKMVKYDNFILTYDEGTHDYYNEPSCTYALLGDIHQKLNDEVEVIENNRKIEPINDEVWNVNKNDLINKINEIIDVINEKEQNNNE